MTPLCRLITCSGRVLIESDDVSNLPSQDELIAGWYSGGNTIFLSFADISRWSAYSCLLAIKFIRDAIGLPMKLTFTLDQDHSADMLLTFQSLLPDMTNPLLRLSDRLYWRRGPDFIVIQDGRVPSRSVLLTESYEISLFQRLSDICDVAQFDGRELDFVDQLALFELVGTLDNWVLAVPYRKLFWKAGEARF